MCLFWVPPFSRKTTNPNSIQLEPLFGCPSACRMCLRVPSFFRETEPTSAPFWSPLRGSLLKKAFRRPVEHVWVPNSILYRSPFLVALSLVEHAPRVAPSLEKQPNSDPFLVTILLVEHLLAGPSFFSKKGPFLVALSPVEQNNKTLQIRYPFVPLLHEHGSPLFSKNNHGAPFWFIFGVPRKTTFVALECARLHVEMHLVWVPLNLWARYGKLIACQVPRGLPR